MQFCASLLCSILLLSACTEQVQQQKRTNYYDFNTFFKKEINRLNGLKPSLQKTVRLNQSEEQKTLKKDIKWENELAFFLEVDLLKPAYKGAYKEQKLGNQIRYRANTSKLPIREVLANMDANGNLKSICIYKSSNNYIYSSSDTLYYFTDSLYRIHKNQKVLLLGTNCYRIEGKF